MVALQSSAGLVFGSAESWNGNVLTVAIVAQLAIGDVVEFRLELPGMEQTALGRVRVIAVKGDRTTAASYQLLVQSIAEADKESFDAWKSAVEAGHPASCQSRHHSAAGWAEAALNGGTTPAERAHAMRIEEERRQRLKATVRQLVQSQKKAWPDPREDDTDDPTITAITNLRPGLNPGRPSVHSSPVLPPARPTLPPAAATVPVPAQAPDPRIDLRPGEVEFRWRTQDRYRQDYKSTLRYRGLFIADSGALRAQTTIGVVLQLPTGARIRAQGEVVNVSANGAAIQFSVSTTDADRLAAAAD
jgi:hypothetical protein